MFVAGETRQPGPPGLCPTKGWNMEGLRNLKILVAEENPVTQRVLSNMLLYCGHSPVGFADTAESVLDTLANGGVDMAILNWNLVADADFALVKEIRKKNMNDGMPIMVMVPGMDEACVSQANGHGIKFCIPKPIPVHLLPDKIQEAMLAGSHGAARQVGLDSSPTPKAAVGHSSPGMDKSAQGKDQWGRGILDMVMPMIPVVEEKAPEFVTNMPDPMEAVPMKKNNKKKQGMTDKETVKGEAAEQAKVHYSMGREALRSRDYKEAAREFELAVRHCGTFPEAYKGLGLAYRAMGDLPRARTCCNRAAQFYVRSGRNQLAAKLYQELVKARLKPLNPFKTMGDLYKSNGKLSKAVSLYELAAQLTPTDPMIAYNLFLLYRRHGHADKALRTVTRLLEAYRGVTDETRRKNVAWAEGVYRKMTGCAFGQEGESGMVENKEESTGPVILIVDDEPHIRILLERSLESLEDDGVTLLFAEDGEEGLDIIKNRQPDLVFLDVMMPKMNGFAVCEIVKQHLGMNDVYIIMLTAKGQEFDRKKGLDAGADVYMTKPFRPQELANLARAVLDL